jgi:transposase
MRFVPAKHVEQQDLQCLHRARSRLIGCRTPLVNQIREPLAEYAIVLPQHVAQLRRHLPALLEDDANELTCRTVDKLVPVTQKHDIEGLVMG